MVKTVMRQLLILGIGMTDYFLPTWFKIVFPLSFVFAFLLYFFPGWPGYAGLTAMGLLLSIIALDLVSAGVMQLWSLWMQKNSMLLVIAKSIGHERLARIVLLGLNLITLYIGLSFTYYAFITFRTAIALYPA